MLTYNFDREQVSNFEYLVRNLPVLVPQLFELHHGANKDDVLVKVH